MRIGVIGRGVVGNATGKAFEGHVDEVRYYDIDPNKRTHHVSEVHQCDLVFVCLPTPQKHDSLECDTSIVDGYLMNLDRIGRADMNVVLRSTVPVGYTRKARGKYKLTGLVHSPEFLTARTAVEDAANPTRLLIGRCEGNSHCALQVYKLYKSRWPDAPVSHMTSDESEFVKLMQNSFSAIKVAAFNEFRCFSDKKGLDWERCMAALLAGGWVNPMHTNVPGPDGLRGFGGACLPKDLANMIQCMDDAKVQRFVTAAALMRNQCIDRKE